ncbi:MAG: hypothetical protein Q4F82_12550 [bacterium]|nr:hypothetical protein [bacterium]
MKKVKKTAAALMLIMAVVCAVGCKKETNNNGGGHYDGNYEYVDLGLPSGTLWATFNVGASVPEEYGDFFAWGETQPKADYKVNNYKYCNGDLKQLTKYCSDAEFGYNGFTDTLTSLQLMDDAASVNWGSDWCMPTAEQWRELIDYTTIADTINNCVYGVLVKASNGQCLFLPAAGNTSYPSYTEGVYCYYWSKTLHIGGLGPAMAWTFANKHPCVQGFGRAAGLPIRPVRSAK